MGAQGWISLHRKIQDNILWQDKPFAKGQAWIDILISVNHKENEVLLGNEVVKVEPGKMITSIRKLCDRWGWSNTKVKNFLELLVKQEMISYKSDTKKTVVKVLNYSEYQGLDNCKNDAKTHQKHNESISKTHQKHTNNNDNNDLIMNNNENKEEKRFEFFFKENVDKFENYLQQMSEAVILKACKISIKKNKPLAYCRAVLNDWTQKGIKNIDDLKVAAKNAKNKDSPENKSDYKWKDFFIDDWDRFKE
ncbi:DnaD domain protein [Halanaerobium salsuginis]|uniref:DnaD and phage-associated domain-containing protein n=1 Tax=Halanaerobium salsuginis TaxID=29563 RepID=A0A1I4EWY4_9FIRM|nr:DnaD domain protein [Halanaerobium salsuginis]SFL09819.1 DnaD and phage-associated domain-containing protein [Halanaerobium salsuginis]